MKGAYGVVVGNFGLRTRVGGGCSGGPGAGRGPIDRAASGTLPQRQPEPPAPRMWPVTLPTLPLRGASGRGRGGPPAPPRAWGVPPAGYTGTYAPDASARPGASPPGGPLNLCAPALDAA